MTRGYSLARPGWTIPVVLFLLAFFVAPLVSNVLRGDTTGRAEQGALGAYVKLLTDPYYAGVLLNTLQVATITTLASLVVGYPVAYFMARYAGRWSGVFVFIVIAPLLTSIIMRTFGWRVLLARRGVVNTALSQLGLMPGRPPNLAEDPVAVYIGLVHVLAPFMVLSILAVLQGVDRRLEESARVLGAGRLRTFLTVTLPLSMDGVITGCILVFVITNGSFLTMLLLGGGKVTTLSLLIYQQFNTSGDLTFAAAMGNVLMLVALIGLGLQLLVSRRARA